MRRDLSAALALAAMVLAIPGQAAAQTIDEKAAVCAGCHGEKGTPIDASIPNIWGQHNGYIYIQLRDFKNKVRVNDIMNGITADMTRDDMRALAEYFSQKPWPNLGQKRAPKEIAQQAETVAASAQCPQCHLGGYVGDGVQPRLAGQSYEYSKRTMLEFRTKVRANNSWMTDLLRTFSESDIDALAQYLAGL
jgi:cytochrome c553